MDRFAQLSEIEKLSMQPDLHRWLNMGVLQREMEKARHAHMTQVVLDHGLSPSELLRPLSELQEMRAALQPKPRLP